MIWIQYEINLLSSDTTIVLYEDDISKLDLEVPIFWEIVEIKNKNKKLLNLELNVSQSVHWLAGSNWYSYAFTFDEKTGFIITTTQNVIQEVISTGIYESRWDHWEWSSLELKKRDKMRLWRIEDILHEKILLLLVNQNKEINDKNLKYLLKSWILNEDEQEYLEEFLNW